MGAQFITGSFEKLEQLKNPKLTQFVSDCISLCKPEKVFVSNGSETDLRFIREESLKNGEESKLAAKGHTIHFDSAEDQGRAVDHTKIVIPTGTGLGSSISTKERNEGLAEVRGIMNGIMEGRTMYVQFHCLGPLNSTISIPCAQITDSAYVTHTENLLYRQGYEEFRRQGASAKFLKFVHSAGELENAVTKNIGKRRIYIDLAGETVYSVNTQYAGNSAGLKKLALRLTIRRASEQGGWLSEHMYLAGVSGPGGRETYFSGAFPSACGKTSTAMVRGGTIVGDDISYLWFDEQKQVRAANAERGMFGIITDVNAKDDPLIWEVLHSPNDLIFSNVLKLADGKVFWMGSGEPTPAKGINYAGEWHEGKADANGKPVKPSHPNARFAVSLSAFKNSDANLDNPKGVPLGGIIYGGRDYDTSVPVQQSFGWEHGIIAYGASLESQTTTATIGALDVRKFDPMANRDFLSISISKYLQSNLDFGASAKEPPPIFSVNYFLKGKDGKFLNAKRDKEVWLKWMELRVHGDAGAIETPTGFIPKYGDLKKLFKEVLGYDYSPASYGEQFTLRIPENLAKMERIIKIYEEMPNAPEAVLRVLGAQKARLLAAQKNGGYITPGKLE